MSEVKDPKIKLFQKTIELPESGGAVSVQWREAAGKDGSDQEPPCSSDSMLENGDLNGDVEEHESREDYDKDEAGTSPLSSDELKDSSDSRPIREDPNARSSEFEAGSEKMTKEEDDHYETSNSREKTLKKPDKIILCPRWNSMDTKLCYFNNYNVNQPRHFCKNWQRYWTAGGMMRSVPVVVVRRRIVLLSSSSRSSTAAWSSKDEVGKIRLPETMAVASFPVPPLPPYWGCAVPDAWRVPWVISSPTLGKHCRVAMQREMLRKSYGFQKH